MFRFARTLSEVKNRGRYHQASVALGAAVFRRISWERRNRLLIRFSLNPPGSGGLRAAHTRACTTKAYLFRVEEGRLVDGCGPVL